MYKVGRLWPSSLAPLLVYRVYTKLTSKFYIVANSFVVMHFVLSIAVLHKRSKSVVSTDGNIHNAGDKINSFSLIREVTQKFSKRKQAPVGNGTN